jgi:hypothetical protein
MAWICKSCLKPWLSFYGFQISNGFKLDDFLKQYDLKLSWLEKHFFAISTC